ncbi:hypothetical protein C7S16_2986 [Burkholderia thailandensis]|uniref:Uncharacterized protein n=1 Tax=Burkholderia thailandensis TaxID=57975 RepID=A0AAW9D5A6_BURTH|nr:hypothetical protein [Burkholderia thailandensis]MDW9257155.1 hypothetical protein [Burkholderia thailandensis]
MRPPGRTRAAAAADTTPNSSLQHPNISVDNRCYTRGDTRLRPLTATSAPSSLRIQG